MSQLLLIMSRFKTIYFILSFPFIFSLYFNMIHKLTYAEKDLNEKVRALQLFTLKHDIVELNNIRFREYVKTPVKNYSFVVLFSTISEHHHCMICDEVLEEFLLTAKSFRMAHSFEEPEQLYFGFADFNQSTALFRSMNINSIPMMIYFPPKRKLQETYDMQRLGFSAQYITKWLIQKTGIHFVVLRPSLFFGSAIATLLFFAGSVVFYLQYEHLGSPFIKSQVVWGLSAVTFCALITSGQMWNIIHSPPLFSRYSNGDISYVQDNSNSQVKAETYIIGVMNFAISMTVIVLIDIRQHNSWLRRSKTFLLTFTFLIALFFNNILYMFKVKVPKYPYHGLLPLLFPQHEK